MEVLSSSGAKAIDRYAIEKLGIPSIVLMENAASKIHDEIVASAESFVVLAGEGNNGGDGLALARKLLVSGKRVKVIIISNAGKRSNDFIINYNILKNMKADMLLIRGECDITNSILHNISDADVVIDSIFGVGINREVTGVGYRLIEEVNNKSKNTISIDVPSGLNADNGEVLGISIKAKTTYSFEVIKKGFLSYRASEYLGNIKIIKIGIPNQVKIKFSELIRILEKNNYKEILPRRKAYGHKGTYGKVIILAGSKGYIGSAYICTNSAIRTGSGLVTTIVEDEIESILMNKCTEGMTVGYSKKEKIDTLIKEADVIACGPGIGRDKTNVDMLEKVIKESNCPIVLDADGLNIVSDKNILIPFLKNRSIFTPHPGEMARLTGKTIDEIEKNRIEISKEYAKKNGVILVLKGFNSIITDGEVVYINLTGSSKIASGGMGDALTGIIASLVGQGIDKLNAALLGCYLHGLCGDRLGVDRYSVCASDLIEEIPKTMEDILIN